MLIQQHNTKQRLNPTNRGKTNRVGKITTVRKLHTIRVFAVVSIDIKTNLRYNVGTSQSYKLSIKLTFKKTRGRRCQNCVWFTCPSDLNGEVWRSSKHHHVTSKWKPNNGTGERCGERLNIQMLTFYRERWGRLMLPDVKGSKHASLISSSSVKKRTFTSAQTSAIQSARLCQATTANKSSVRDRARVSSKKSIPRVLLIIRL